MSLFNVHSFFVLRFHSFFSINFGKTFELSTYFLDFTSILVNDIERKKRDKV